jgi:hypothetical protein
MSLNFVFTLGVRSGHHRHPNTVEAAELLHECIHFFGPLCILSVNELYYATKSITDSYIIYFIAMFSVFVFPF